jgi:hypothetical protein
LTKKKKEKKNKKKKKRKKERKREEEKKGTRKKPIQRAVVSRSPLYAASREKDESGDREKGLTALAALQL